MKRSIQEIVELVVFGLIAVIVGTGLLWLVGWLIGLLGGLFKWVAGILWIVLTYVIPVVVIIAAIFFLFRLLQNRNRRSSEAQPAPVVSGPQHTGSAAQVTPAAAPVTTPQVQGMPYNPDGTDTPSVTHEPVASETVVDETARTEQADSVVEVTDPEPVEGNDEDNRKA